MMRDSILDRKLKIQNWHRVLLVLLILFFVYSVSLGIYHIHSTGKFRKLDAATNISIKGSKSGISGDSGMSFRSLKWNGLYS